ncbi:MAG: asparaginase domain-containing protein, partial [Nanoarchaeota archaeon]
MKKQSFTAGDLIEVTTTNEKIKGTFLPSKTSKILSLKLDSGYNLSIKNSEIKSIKLLEKHKPIVSKLQQTKTKKGLPTISILHTGGTISSRVDYKTGAVSAQFSPEDLIKKFPDLQKYGNIRSRLISNLLS